MLTKCGPHDSVLINIIELLEACASITFTTCGPHGSASIKHHWIGRDMCKTQCSKSVVPPVRRPGGGRGEVRGVGPQGPGVRIHRLPPWLQDIYFLGSFFLGVVSGVSWRQVCVSLASAVRQVTCWRQLASGWRQVGVSRASAPGIQYYTSSKRINATRHIYIYIYR